MHTMHIPHNIGVVPPVAEWDCQMMGIASFPGPSPPPEERPGTHCLRMCEIFSVKSFVHFLVRMRKIILTKNTEFSLN